MQKSDMPQLLTVYGLRLVVWATLSILGCLLWAKAELSDLQAAFETDARISHRLLSQRAAQHEAVLATLALLQPGASPGESDPAAQRLSSVYPQILSVLRRTPGTQWHSSGLEEAEQASRQSHSAVLANADFASARGQYRLVLSAQPASYALLIDVRNTVPWNEWPMPVQTSPVRLTLENAGQAFLVQPGRIGDAGWRFGFSKQLSSVSQPFNVVAVRQVGWQELPWAAMVGWTLLVAAAIAAWSAWQRQRTARRRAEELLRFGQISRLNALGELAAGMAHELNQPLTAILANTQAAKRLLHDDPAELPTALQAMDQAVAQAHRAAEVLGRLRHAVERPLAAPPGETLDLAQAVGHALYLVEPECKRLGVTTKVEVAQRTWVLAERVATEQIVHNLITNALQALERVPAGGRQLSFHIERGDTMAVLRVVDTGPGIAPDTLHRVFEPFFSTREGGLGLGLSLCETLASGMGGQLRAQAHVARGAVFVLALPLAPGA